MAEKIPMYFGIGLTLSSALLLYIIFYWEITLGALLTSQILHVSLISFIIGLIGAFTLRLLRRRTDYNITSIFILLFGIFLYLIAGDIALANIPMDIFLTTVLISAGISIGVTLIAAQFLNRK
jgi:hypothetical protein